MERHIASLPAKTFLKRYVRHLPVAFLSQGHHLVDGASDVLDGQTLVQLAMGLG